MRLRSLLMDVRPLQLPAYRRLWFASAVTAIGGSFSGLAVPLQLFELTGSSAYAAAAAAVSMATLIGAALGTGATVPSVVPADLLAAASSLSSVTRYTGAVLGPLLAGLRVTLWTVARLPRLTPILAVVAVLRAAPELWRYTATSSKIAATT
ncbi:hypothetical protein ACFVDI_13780 [Nocardioides sp. NPDC057767]|uniref:hypothetical protein n=1 Tax=unclassified Nocardioides TaxID=2615069 RepID=UPI00366F9125